VAQFCSRSIPLSRGIQKPRLKSGEFESGPIYIQKAHLSKAGNLRDWSCYPWKKGHRKQTKSISTQILIVKEVSEIILRGGWSRPMSHRGVPTKRRSLIGAGHATPWARPDQLDVDGDIGFVCLRWPFFMRWPVFQTTPLETSINSLRIRRISFLLGCVCVSCSVCRLLSYSSSTSRRLWHFIPRYEHSDGTNGTRETHRVAFLQDADKEILDMKVTVNVRVRVCAEECIKRLV
jgi:hypothetical protein